MEVQSQKIIVRKRASGSAPPAAPPKPPPPAPPPAAKAGTLPPREPLQPAQRTLGGLPLAGHPNQQHAPLMSGNLGGVQLFRCRCGLLLAESGGQLWWAPVATAIMRIADEQQLAEILATRCWHQKNAKRIAAQAQRRAERSQSAV